MSVFTGPVYDIYLFEDLFVKVDSPDSTKQFCLSVVTGVFLMIGKIFLISSFNFRYSSDGMGLIVLVLVSMGYGIVLVLAGGGLGLLLALVGMGFGLVLVLEGIGFSRVFFSDAIGIDLVLVYHDYGS